MRSGDIFIGSGRVYGITADGANIWIYLDSGLGRVLIHNDYPGCWLDTNNFAHSYSGERRAIALSNPGLACTPYATPTLWAAIHYLGGRETAPELRHSQNDFRFVVEGEGEGVWTVVNGDPVRMSRGDFLLTPGWNLHGHHNDTDEPMAWIDGLDFPFVHYADAGFFEFGTERVTDEATPDISRAERLWAHPGLRPLSGQS